MRNSRAFSLLEIIVSLSILLTGVLLMVTLFTRLFSQAQKTEDHTAGALIADSVLSQELYACLATAPIRQVFFDGIASGIYDTPGQLTQGVASNAQGTQFNYVIRAVYLSDVGNTPNNRSAKVEVSLNWNGGTRHDAGILRVELARVVNENSRY